MNAARRPTAARFARHRAAVALAQRRDGCRLSSADRGARVLVSPGDGAGHRHWQYRSFPDGTVVRYCLSASDSTRVGSDGGGDQHVTGSDIDSDPGHANTDLRDAADATAARHLPDFNTEGGDMFTTDAAAANRDADPTLPSGTWKRLRQPGRGDTVADTDTYNGLEYEVWAE